MGTEATCTHVAQVEEQLASSAVVQHEVQLVLRLKREVEAHDERVVDLAKHVALRFGVGNLAQHTARVNVTGAAQQSGNIVVPGSS